MTIDLVLILNSFWILDSRKTMRFCNGFDCFGKSCGYLKAWPHDEAGKSVLFLQNILLAKLLLFSCARNLAKKEKISRRTAKTTRRWESFQGWLLVFGFPSIKFLPEILPLGQI